ncbi:50S ribosomal protein L11, partial [Candidatus Parvarchaeota archaeon]|nr:50S ribosomal protein L11 [Candidatus Parvarchaeota archaeon]
VAKMKANGSLAKSIKDGVKEVLGTCVSLGVTCEGKDPRKVIEEIDQGGHEAQLKSA